MARRKKRKSILDWVTLPKLPSFDLDPDTRKGFFASLFVLFCLLVVSLLLMLNTTLVALFGRESFVAKMFYPVNFVFIKIFGIFKKNEEDIGGGEEEEEEDDEKKEENHEDIKFKSSPVQNENENSVWWAPTGFETIPPINLLSGKKGKPTSGDIKENKIIIEKALNNFGIPVEMGEISVGPTVTQYTF